MINTVSSKFINIKQGTEEWVKWRELGIGGSDVGSIMGQSPYKTKYQLWLEKTKQVEPEDLSLNFSVQRGHALEEEARNIINKTLGKNFSPSCFESNDFNFLKFSCDGFDIYNNEIIEIKCPGIKNHLLTIEKGIPLNYLYQIQYGLMITDAKKAYYVSYNLEQENNLIILEVEPDHIMQATIFEEVSNFWTKVISLTPPELTNKDISEITSDEFRELSKVYREEKAQFELAESRLNEIEEKLKNYAKNKKILNGIGFGVKIQLISKKGNVDYSKISVLKEIDIEKYRKQSTSYYKITIA